MKVPLFWARGCVLCWRVLGELPLELQVGGIGHPELIRAFGPQTRNRLGKTGSQCALSVVVRNRRLAVNAPGLYSRET